MATKVDMHGIEIRRRKRADGSESVRYRVRAVHLDGSRTGDTFTDLDAAIEERDRLDRIAERIASGPPSRGKATVGDLKDRWWDEHVIPELAPRTIKKYAQAWLQMESTVAPWLAIGVARRDVKELRIELLDRGVGPTSVNQCLDVLHALLEYALEDDLLDFNPVDGVKKVRRATRKVEPRDIPSVLDVERARVHAVKELRSPMTATIISVGIADGPRPSEWRALKWYDIGADTVTTARVAEPDGTLRNGDKNQGAGLTRPTPEWVMQDLAAWREISPYPADEDPVFPRGDGGHLTEDDYRNWATRRFGPCFAAVGFALTPYDLRHIAICLLIQEGTQSLAQIAERHGNSVAMISRHYSHVIAAYAGGKINLEAEVRKARRKARSSLLLQLLTEAA